MDIKALHSAIKKLPDTELRNLMKSAELELLRRGESHREALRKRLGAMAAREGLSLEDLVSTKPEKKITNTKRTSTSVAKVRPKKTAKKTVPEKVQGIAAASAVFYRNPADKAITWSGKGRRPAWVTAHLEAGGQLAQLRGRSRRNAAE